MRSDRTVGSLTGAVFAMLLPPLLAACSESPAPVFNDAAMSGGSGGAAGSGGTDNKGGTTTSGGVSGSGGSGGVTESGGKPGTGGKASGGTTSPGTGGGRAGATGTKGGATGQGGATPMGGTVAKGGNTGNGGATGRGGDTGVDGGGNAGGTGGSTGGGGCPALPAAPASNVITFADAGGWCWYQDERAVVDTKGGKLIIGSVIGAGSGVGNIQATIYDLASKKGTTSKLGNLTVDDHNAPAMMVRPDGKYLAVWATHRTDCNTYYSIHDGSAWATQRTFDWKKEGCPWDGDNTHMITYSNVWYLDGKLIDIARSVGTSPNLLSSTDDGATWGYFGRLTYTPLTGYVAGYYKYWGNNTDRIDFLATEAHPRDNNNSLYHGYMKDGKIYNSTGTVVDDALAGTSDSTSAKNINTFTKLFATGSTVGKVKLERAWNYDIVRYDDGTIAILGQGRVSGTGSDDPDKRSFYGRFDGTKWTLTYLAKMGSKLYSSEQDYTGLGALHPDNPNIIYISTTYDPRDDTTTSSKHEIRQGVTCDKGATFDWAPITKGSSQDNIRPIVPKWDADHTALLWMQGTYRAAQDYTMSIKGTISGP